MATAKNITDQIDEMIKVAGFEIKEWIFSKDRECNDVDISSTFNDMQKVLGISWNRSLDVLKYKVKINFSPKKEVSMMMKI